jgi:hypothetical protein
LSLLLYSTDYRISGAAATGMPKPGLFVRG